MKAKRPKFHTFNGKRYKLIWRSCNKNNEEGRCDNPSVPAKQRNMFISPSQNPKALAMTIIHEALHAEVWCLDEETVTRTAKNINDLLWKCGFKLEQV